MTKGTKKEWRNVNIDGIVKSKDNLKSFLLGPLTKCLEKLYDCKQTHDKNKTFKGRVCVVDNLE